MFRTTFDKEKNLWYGPPSKTKWTEESSLGTKILKTLKSNGTKVAQVELKMIIFQWLFIYCNYATYNFFLIPCRFVQLRVIRKHLKICIDQRCALPSIFKSLAVNVDVKYSCFQTTLPILRHSFSQPFLWVVH